MVWTPDKAAIKISRISKVFSDHFGAPQFPVDVERLALDAANQFGWKDPISEITAAEFKGFEGGLFAGPDKKNWKIVYNKAISSPGRIRFTQAHELGHYILHRLTKDQFTCSYEDMIDWTSNGKNIEAEADSFASSVLMPIDDYRNQIASAVDIETFKKCSARYGVSLTAALLKWINYTEEKAVLILSSSGYMNWSVSSRSAWKSGAYFKTKGNTVPLPSQSLAASPDVTDDWKGTGVPTKAWFEHADTNANLREMKFTSEQYELVITLLCLPKYATCWPPKSEREGWARR